MIAWWASLGWQGALLVYFALIFVLCVLGIAIASYIDPIRRQERDRRRRAAEYRAAHPICSPQISRAYVLACNANRESDTNQQGGTV